MEEYVRSEKVIMSYEIHVFCTYLFMINLKKNEIKVYFNMNTSIFERQCRIESCKRLSMEVCQNFMRLSTDNNDSLTLLK